MSQKGIKSKMDENQLNILDSCNFGPVKTCKRCKNVVKLEEWDEPDRWFCNKDLGEVPPSPSTLDENCIGSTAQEVDPTLGEVYAKTYKELLKTWRVWSDPREVFDNICDDFEEGF